MEQKQNVRDTTRHKVRRFKSAAIALKELAPYVRDGEHLLTGKPFPNFHAGRSRELWANWLICAPQNFEAGEERLTFTSDPTGGDGIMLDVATGDTWPTEHVIALTKRGASGADTEAEILKAVTDKVQRGGEQYARGKTLVVFTNLAGGSTWNPTAVARKLPNPLHFGSVWVVAIQGVVDGEYVYAVSLLDVEAQAEAPAWRVRINKSFEVWQVERLR
jgi:hypothetical protein